MSEDNKVDTQAQETAQQASQVERLNAQRAEAAKEPQEAQR